MLTIKCSIRRRLYNALYNPASLSTNFYPKDFAVALSSAWNTLPQTSRSLLLLFFFRSFLAMLSKSDTVFTHSTFYLSSLFFSTVFISVWHILYLTYIPFNCLLPPFKCKCSTGTHLPEMGEGLELHMCSLAWQPEEGERQMWPTLALIAGKAGHYYWPSAHMVFWERTLDVECTGKQKRQLVLSPPRDGRVCINSDQCRPVSGGLGTQTPKDA